MSNEPLFKDIRNRTSLAQMYVTSATNLVCNYHSYRSKFQRQQAWFMRLWLHQELHPELRAYLVTCTYRPECHPIYNVRTHLFGRGYFPSPYRSDGITREFRYDKDSIPVFSKTDKTLFFKKLRKRLGNGIKYLWCSEFGKRFTKRAHYHSIIYVDAKFSPSEVLQALRESWSAVVRYEVKDNLKVPVTISLGNVDIACGKDGLPWVHNSEGFRYASKYITKDTYLDEDERYTSLSDEEKERIKPFMPFKASSTNLGVNWWEKYSENVLFDGIPVPVLQNGNRIIKKYPLPPICVDRYFYEHKYIKGVKRNFAEIMSDFEFGQLLEDKFVKREIDSKEYEHFVNLLSDVVFEPSEFKWYGKWIRVVALEHIDEERELNKHTFHVKSLRADRVGLYKRYVKHMLTETAKRWALLTDTPYDVCYRALIWSRVRGMLCCRDSEFVINPFTTSELLDILCARMDIEREQWQPLYGVDNVKVMLENGALPMSCNPYMQQTERDLLNLYEIMLNRSEKMIIDLREKEDAVKFARESIVQPLIYM